MNRLVRKRFADGVSVDVTYTLSGQRSTVTDARGTTTYSYDANDRLSRVTHPGGEVVEDAYDGNGLLERLTSPGGTVTYD